MRLSARWIALPLMLLAGCSETTTNPEPVRQTVTRLIDLRPTEAPLGRGSRLEDDGEGLRSWRMIYDNAAKDESWASAFLAPTFSYDVQNYPGEAVLDAPAGQPLKVFFPSGSLGVEQMRVTATAIRTAEGIWAIDLGPSPYHFRKPVSLIIQYGGLALDDIDPATLRVVWFNPSTGVWDPLPTQNDRKARVAVAQVDHFSRFGLTGDVIIVPPPIDSLLIH